MPKVVTQQRRGRDSNPRLLDRKSDALPLSHRATQADRTLLQYRLRQCSHNKIMISKTVDLNDRDFIVRMLYKDIILLIFTAL